MCVRTQLGRRDSLSRTIGNHLELLLKRTRFAGQEQPLFLLEKGFLTDGSPNINDNAEIAELIACGSHLILFTTGRGSVVGSAISPVIKVCANPETFQQLRDDMDIDSDRILYGQAELAEIGDEIVKKSPRDSSRGAYKI